MRLSATLCQDLQLIYELPGPVKPQLALALKRKRMIFPILQFDGLLLSILVVFQ